MAMLKVVPHLTFRGECEAAFAVYAACLGREVVYLRRYRETDGPFPAELAERVFHATLRVGEQTVTGVDVAAETYDPPCGFALQLNLENAARAKAIYAALGEGGEVQFALAPTAWAEAYAALTDRFGTPWELNCGRFG